VTCMSDIVVEKQCFVSCLYFIMYSKYEIYSESYSLARNRDQIALKDTTE
jgi:hypothetical protein